MIFDEFGAINWKMIARMLNTLGDSSAYAIRAIKTTPENLLQNSSVFCNKNRDTQFTACFLRITSLSVSFPYLSLFLSLILVILKGLLPNIAQNLLQDIKGVNKGFQG